jgi:hypothetical protein
VALVVLIAVLIGRTTVSEELQKSLPPGEAGRLDSTATVLPLGMRTGLASTDAGDVSRNVPTIGFRAAIFVPGVVAHHQRRPICGCSAHRRRQSGIPQAAQS